jgi:hypothetical protein
MKTGPKPIEPIIRFWKYVRVATWPGACWEWTGGSFPSGYGMFGPTHDHKINAHRWLYEYTHGPLGSLCALHRCDNRRCVRPSHIWAGTKKENTHDMMTKGRHVPRSKRRPIGQP